MKKLAAVLVLLPLLGGCSKHSNQADGMVCVTNNTKSVLLYRYHETPNLEQERVAMVYPGNGICVFPPAVILVTP